MLGIFDPVAPEVFRGAVVAPDNRKESAIWEEVMPVGWGCCRGAGEAVCCIEGGGWTCCWKACVFCPWNPLG